MQILIIKKYISAFNIGYLRKNFKPREPSFCLVIRHKKEHNCDKVLNFFEGQFEFKIFK